MSKGKYTYWMQLLAWTAKYIDAGHPSSVYSFLRDTALKSIGDGMAKPCACGEVHRSIPAKFKLQMETEAIYFECRCGSTITFIPDRERTLDLVRSL